MNLGILAGIFPSGRPNTRNSGSTPAPKGVNGLRLACWNVRTMLDSTDSNHPQRRSALVAHELSRLNVDIAALSEVRFPEVGSLKEQGAGYTLFWSGKPQSERRLSGVGFMIQNTIAAKLENLPTGHSDRIMSMRLPLRKKQYITLFSVYAPTLQADPADKDKFYSDLRNLVRSTPADDKVIILGDFNARVGRDSEAWKGVLGKHGVGNCNDNGRLLLEFCTEMQLTITNTIFQQRNRLKTTWMHPRSRHWHLLDYILVRQRDLGDVLHTRVMPSAECHTDHRLVRCKLNVHFKPKPKLGGPPRKKLHVDSLKSDKVRADLQSNLQSKLEGSDCATDTCPETLWAQLKTVILKSSEEVLGFTTKKNKDWFDENDSEIQQLLAKKRTAHQAHLAQPSCPIKKAVFRSACSHLQRKLRTIQNRWWTSLAEKTQLCADNGDHRGFYEALKAVYGPTHQLVAPLRSTDGQSLLTDKASILNRWSEHFQTLFSVNRTVDNSALQRIHQQPLKEELDLLPSLEEVIKAVDQQKSGKAAGVDGIPPEVWKHGGVALHSKLHELLVHCWEQGKLPQDLRDAVIITLYKNKGEKADCSNYRGITLLSIAGKILARVLLNRLVPAVAVHHLPESQCGFRANRGTTDMVFVLRQLQEKCREQNKGLYITFVDLSKAFDTVSRKGLWEILERLGCPPKFLNMVIQLHEQQRGQVRSSNDLSEHFPVSNGVKQGCVLAPTLFTIFFSMMLQQATEDLGDEDGIYIRYRTDGSLFNLRRLQAHTKTLEQLIRELLFADDAALVAHTEPAMQRVTSCFAEAAKLFGLEVSLKKTEVLHQPAPQEAYRTPYITIGETELKAVQQFTYLGSTISSDARIDKEVDNRLAKANSAFGRLYRRVWSSKHLKKGTKVSVYRAVVLTTLLYGSESWVTYRQHLRLLERFHQRCLRSILNIHWSDYVTNVEVLERAEITSIEAMLMKTQLRWAGHVSRMEDHRLPKIILYGELSTGHRNRGAPKKRFKDTLKKSLQCCNIDYHQWSALAADRGTWRHTVHQAVSSFDKNRRTDLQEKRSRRKNRTVTAPNPESSFPCSRCGRVCRSRIGLVSHQRACTSGLNP
ncbi:Hypp8672 [Branchiostoma lanceolatum]|uniref:Hypp8672 protein n=1 Tax=Branchiostoma lanceolatum TaxID=7740 RepID=A0A8K0EG69_BRALA|nr:Hypp8672 [Branchiostoma lanceolatum]